MKLVRYIWAFPTTSIGLLVAAMALISNGHLRVIDGVIEVYGGLASFLLKNCVPIKGGADAMTLGHVVVGRSMRSLEQTRKHERAHVRQCEQWGPAFIPAYLACGLIEMLRGNDAYHDNYFERKAVQEEAL